MSLIYRFRLEDGTYIKRPIIDIALKKENKSLEFSVILDSGSDITTVPQAIADILGLEVKDEENEMIGYKGRGKIKNGKVMLILKGKMQRIDGVLQDVPIAVMQDPEEQEVVVGTKGVFEPFKILFNDGKSVSLTRLPNVGV